MSTRRAQGRRPQPARRAATRAALLDAARGVFARQGFAASTLDDIAAAAGMTKGALYYAFDSKEALFLALQEERFDALAADVGRLSARADSGSDSVGAAAAAELPLDREWNQLFLEFVAHAGRRPSFRERLRERLAGRRTTHADAIRQLAHAADRELTMPADRLARLMAALANGLALDALVDPGADAQALLGDGFQLLWAAATRPK